MPRDYERISPPWMALTAELEVALEYLESLIYQLPPLPSPDWSGEILRPDDLLYLTVSAYNLHASGTVDGPQLVRVRPDTPSILVFEFPPQAIAERAFFEPSTTVPQLPEGADPTADANRPRDTVTAAAAPARISRVSRLVFRLPTGADRIDLSTESLLAWETFEPVLAPLAALPARPSAAQIDSAPEVSEPAPLETVIEMPYRLFLSPNTTARWIHRRGVAEHGGHAELWHTRIAALVDGAATEASVTDPVPLRALWTPGYRVGDPPDKKDEEPGLGLTAMNPNDRHQIVTLTAGFATYRDYRVPEMRPRPIEADRLMLSALGGWLRSRGHWEPPEPQDGWLVDHRFPMGQVLGLPVARAIPIEGALIDLLARNPVYLRPPEESLDLREWVHDAAQGRDHYVRLVYDGCLYPFGHPASLIKVTERRFEEVDRRPIAVLRQYVYVVVRQPVQSYSPGEYPYRGREMPLRRIEVKTRVTPRLRQPDSAPALVAGTDYTFWMLDNQTHRDVQFDLVGTDDDGRTVSFTMPLIFVRRDERRMDLVKQAWSESTVVDDGDERPRRRAVCNGALIDLAPNGPGGKNSVVPIQAMYFDVTGDGACGDYAPTLFKADVTLPAVEQFTQHSGAVTIGYPDTYLKHGFDHAAGVFAQIELDMTHVQAAGQLPVTFAAVQAGGIATPNAALTYLTTTLGPIAGHLDDALSGQFDPKTFFASPPATTAKLFGSIPLAELIPEGQLGADAPKLNTYIDATGRFAVAAYRWETAPRQWPDPDSGIIKLIPNGGARLIINCRTETALSGGDATTVLSGSMSEFDIEFVKAITIAFRTFAFSSVTGRKPDFRVELAPDAFTFGGDLEFVHTLSDLIPPGIFGDGPSIDLRPDAVALSYNIGLPPTPVGVFTMKNLSLNAGLQLPFTTGKPALDFGFARRADPFLLTVSLLGGGGYVNVQLDPSGLRIIEVSLEFGAAVELDLGVASGSVHVFAGVYIQLEKRDGDLQAVLSGFWRTGGALCVLGLVTVSVEFNISFAYDTNTKKISGRATVTVNVEVANFSKAVHLTLERSFGRDGGDPSFGDLIHTPTVWSDYADAFA
ncbi:hypothetical protein FHT44_006299 [Mycolicibacterium sp. BK634]|uniref:hypothetical protein n=1 Tax=Mycolicibacterium sp. BK634 TaxID=2587099 RepID=UPI0016145081|nr:hypothetical protein [Mycolicibacterium sp. BK634]MBB3753777.1 hypothetical protein [Mycolicibacterium sp. BK634]